MVKTFLTSTAMVLMLSGAVMAQGSSPGAAGSTGSTATPPSATTTPGATGGSATTGSSATTSSSMGAGSNVKASNLIGLSVKNPQDETIGEVDDVLVGQDGKVEQVVVSVGGFLGIGSKKVAIDWDELKMDASRDMASVNMTKDQLKNAPEYKAEPRTTAGSGSGSATGTSGSSGGAMRGSTPPAGSSSAPARTQ